SVRSHLRLRNLLGVAPPVLERKLVGPVLPVSFLLVLPKRGSALCRADGLFGRGLRFRSRLPGGSKTVREARPLVLPDRALSRLWHAYPGFLFVPGADGLAVHCYGRPLRVDAAISPGLAPPRAVPVAAIPRPVCLLCLGFRERRKQNRGFARSVQ